MFYASKAVILAVNSSIVVCSVSNSVFLANISLIAPNVNKFDESTSPPSDIVDVVISLVLLYIITDKGKDNAVRRIVKSCEQRLTRCTQILLYDGR